MLHLRVFWPTQARAVNHHPNHHHAGAVCWFSGMAMANQRTPSPRASVEGVGQGWCVRVLFILADWPRKKTISIYIRFFYYSASFPPLCHQNDVVAPPALRPKVISPLLSLFHHARMFFLVVAYIHQTAAIKDDKVIYFHYLFVAQFDGPNDGMASPHTLCPLCASSLTSPVPRKLTFSWLLCVIIKQRPPKARDQSLFLCGGKWPPKQTNPPWRMAPPNQMASALHCTIGSGSAMHWWHRWSTHGGRGQSCWR